jgi:CHAT domain-containing protein
LFDTTWPPSFENLDDVKAAAASFPGFAAVVRRVPPADELPQSTVFASPPLNVAFVPEASLGGVDDELRNLRALHAYDVEEAFPRKKLESGQATTILSQRMFNACSTTSGRNPDQILHFACHCDSETNRPEDWRLRIGADSRVYMNDLIQQIGSYWDDGDPTPAPLVFMNACGTSTINPFSAASFVAVVVDLGNVAFVGTETNVPDRIAVEYAKYFYGLLSNRSVGEAMQGAKWRLLERYMNPLGVLYTLYGNPDLRLPQSLAA